MIKVLKKDQLVSYLVNYFKELSKKEINKKGFFNIALSGGSTPLEFYEKLSLEKDINWDKIYIFFVDERMVSNLDIKSNIYQIKKTLIDKINIKNVFYINKELNLEDAREEYELFIKDHFKEKKPSFDFILLGLGEDGHSASIFPESDLIHEKKDLIGFDQKKGDGFFRMSFTFELINRSKNIVFLITGDKKKFIVKKLLLDKDLSVVASKVKAKDNMVYLLDEKAAYFFKL
jgi:6-phosphogluconolactonase